LKSKNGGSEDVSYMMERVQKNGGQATFMRILTQTAAPAHARKFDFDEEVLAKGIKVFSAVAYDIMKN
jgi:aminobenzoyl-glutamate utilization protein A